MKMICFLLLTTVMVAVNGHLLQLDERWETFKEENNRKYATVEVERYRRGIWQETIKNIEQHNIEEQNGVHSYTMKETKWDDMTYEEFMEHGDGNVVNEMPRVKRASRNGTGDCFNEDNWNDTNPYQFTAVAELPANVDWSQKGYVTSVKNQASCGSCWAFSAVGSIEGQWYRKTGTLVSLSPQFLVDCSARNGRCKGGLPSRAFKDIIDKKGIPSEQKYPYVGSERTCKTSTAITASIKGYMTINARSELQNAVAYVGPISVGIKTGNAIRNVDKGVFTDCTGPVNHAVLVVGYGIYKGQKVWKIKNSWGPTWGDKGYFYMTRGGKTDCGIYSTASYPTMDGNTRGSGSGGAVSHLGAVISGSVYNQGSLSLLTGSVCLALGVLKTNYMY